LASLDRCPDRRRFLVGLAATLSPLGQPQIVFAQSGFVVPWVRVPTITILSAGPDARSALVRQAVIFWNQTFAELGSAFRLGAVSETAGEIPAAELIALSEAMLRRAGPSCPRVSWRSKATATTR
jgi:hypothetical protein